MNIIEKVRREKGITQAELAKAACVSQPYIHDLEHGNRGAKRDTLVRIAAALGCTIDDLQNDVSND